MEYISTNLQNTKQRFRKWHTWHSWQNRLEVVVGKQLATDYCNIPHEAGHEEAKNKGRFHPVGELDRLFKQGRNVQAILNPLD